MKLNYIQGNRIGKIRNVKNTRLEPETKPVTVIDMSCGGGMGGSSWSECVERLENDLKSNSLQKVRTIDGDEIIINTSFVVKIQNHNLMTLREESYYNGEIISKDFLTKENIDYEFIDDKKLTTIAYSDTVWTTY